MSITRTAVILLGLTLVAACATAPAPVVTETNWAASAAATSAFTGAGANVNVRTTAAGTTVAIAYREVAGASGTVRPWHIHRGRCGDDRGIVGDPNAYPVLRPGADGTATATATLNVPLMADESYFVNIHESPTNLGSIVACGNLNVR